MNNQSEVQLSGVPLSAATDDAVYAISMKAVLLELSRRISADELSRLSAEELKLLIEEVQAVLETELDYRDYLNTAIDNWEVIRNL